MREEIALTTAYRPKTLPPEFPFGIKFADMAPYYAMDHTFHWHNYFEISYVRQGLGRYYIENRAYDIKAGDMIIINNTELHYMEVLPPTRMQQPVIMFDPGLIQPSDPSAFDEQYLMPFVNRSASFSNKIDGESEVGLKIFSLLDEIEDEYTRQPAGYPLMIKAKLLQIITLLVRHYRDDSRPVISSAQQQGKLAKLQPVFDYIEDNLGHKIMLEQLATKAYLSPHHFCSFFRSSTGFTPIGYLNKRRISRAIQLLKNANRKISDVALECGFGNLAHFNRVFRKLTGQTPGQIRKSSL